MSAVAIKAGETQAKGSRVMSFPLPGKGEEAMIGLGNWSTYRHLDNQLQSRGLRVRYHRGTIEIMSISFLHELLKGNIRQFIETHCLDAGLDYINWGSTTQRLDEIAGGEPDESYTFGLEAGDMPQLVIEVALTSGGIDKLGFWGELEISEVWIWQNDTLSAFAWFEGAYMPTSQSHVLPGFPLELARDLARIEPSSAAVRTFRERMM